MKVRSYKFLHVCLFCFLNINLNAIEETSLIQIESTTIYNKYEDKKNKVSNTITLSTEDIEEEHTENIGSILNNIAGVTVRVNEGDSNKIHIRGVATELYMGEKPGVAIVIDGVPVQERAGSVNIDSDNIESIKVIKGSASYLYGNDAIGGAIVITTKRPKGKNTANLSYDRGSFDYQKTVINYFGSTDDFSLELQASDKQSDGYWEDSDYWTKSINGKFQYYINDTSDITFGADKTRRFENDTGSITHTIAGVNQVVTNPTSEGEVGYATEYNINLDKYFLTYSDDIRENSNLMLNVYSYEDTTTNKSSAFDSNGDGQNDDHKYDSFSNTKQNGFKSEYRLSANKYALMLGLDLARNDEDKNNVYRVDYKSYGITTNKGTVYSDTSSKEEINALYGELKYQVSPSFLGSLNLRVDNISYDYENNLTSSTLTKDFTETSYRIGSVYEVNDKSSIYSNISTGFRVPTLSQMYAGDMSTSTYSGTYSNNTDIKTEKTLNLEIGYRKSNDFFDYDLALYELRRNDVIGIDSGNYASTSGVDVQYDNMSDIRNRGLEFTINSNNDSKFSWGLNYTYLNSKYTSYDEYNLILNEAGTDLNANGKTDDDYVEGVYNLAGNTVPRTSKHSISLATNYKVLTNLDLGVQINYKSSQFADELNRIKIDAYTTVNLTSKYTTKVNHLDVEFFGRIENLFNNQYYMMPRVTGDRNDDGVYDEGDLGLSVNPGRVFYAGLKIKI